MALSLTWSGHADTNIAFSEFFADNHTITVRFMLQFANIYTGPMIAVNGSGVYFIGTGDGGGGNNKISIRIGNKSLDISIPISFKETWHHIAIVRNGQTFTAFLDGAWKGYQTITSSNIPNGTVRLGRSNEIHQQFYGFLDDFAIFKAALSPSEIMALATAKTLKGTEAKLYVGFVFGDGITGNIPASFSRPLTYVPGAINITVSNDRNNITDAPLLPLSLVNHMHLPFEKGKIAKVVQGFGGTVSHNGYAAFCYDFVFVNEEINGYTFKVSSPGTIAHVWEGGPNTDQGPSNFISIRQGNEFCDYLHFQQNSAIPNTGQNMIYDDALAKVGRSGTIGPHLHVGVTNFGEFTTDRDHFITIPFAFSNYEYSDDNGQTWHHVIRGYLKEGQWVRSYISTSTVRYTAVWIPNSTGEQQVYEVTYATYRAYYDQIWSQGWRLYSLKIVVVKEVPLYTAIFRPENKGECQIYNATYTQYRARYDELWPQGWRLKLLARYCVNGQILYSAAWMPGSGGEQQIYDATYDQYRGLYDQLWPQGWRLKLIDVIEVGSELQYAAVWQQSTIGEIQLYNATYQEFNIRFNELWQQGWRLQLISIYNAGGIRVTAIWHQTNEVQILLHGWEFTDIRATYDVMWQQGWRLKLLNSFVV